MLDKIRSCRFIPVSVMECLPGYEDFMDEMGMRVDVTWGHAKHTLVSRHLILDWLFQYFPNQWLEIRTAIGGLPTDVLIDLET